MAKVENKNGLWYVVFSTPNLSNPIVMGGYATEENAKEMRDFLVKELS